LEPGGVDEMIIAAVDLARPLLARRHRDRKLDAWIGVEQLARQRGLACARGRGQHQHEPAAGDGIASLVTAACRHRLIPNSAPARGTALPRSLAPVRSWSTPRRSTWSTACSFRD